jgi:ribosomal protein S12 methylthiotransferase accessory factor
VRLLIETLDYEHGLARTLQTMIDRLARLGIETFAVDLTRPAFAIPAVRVVAPGPQLYPTDIITGPLAAISATGGGQPYTQGLALL